MTFIHEYIFYFIYLLIILFNRISNVKSEIFIVIAYYGCNNGIPHVRGVLMGTKF